MSAPRDERESALSARLRRTIAPPVAVARKELRQALRDKRVMALLTVAPVLQLLVLGHAANLEVDRVPTVVVDLDDTQDSRRALAELLADDTLREVARERAPDDATRWLVDGRASVALIVPEGWSRSLRRAVPGDPARVQVLVDGTDPNRSGIAGSAALRFFSVLAQRLVRERLLSSRASLLALSGQSADLGVVTASALGAASGQAPPLRPRSRWLAPPSSRSRRACSIIRASRPPTTWSRASRRCCC
jgi:ABC-type Na+ efflux pump permease subunit